MMKGPLHNVLVLCLFSILTLPGLMTLTGSGDPDVEDIYGRTYEEISHDPIFDRVVEVPPGGETRVFINETGAPSVQGFTGLSQFEYGRTARAAALLPTWLREPFLENMLAAGSSPILAGSSSRPTFGDLDGDGDDDLVIARGMELVHYENVGWDGNPLFVKGDMDQDMKFISSFAKGDWLCPLLYDINGDGYADHIISDEYSLSIILSPGNDTGVWRINTLTSPGIGHRSLTMIECGHNTYEGEKEGHYELTFISGERSGAVKTRGVILYDEIGEIYEISPRYLLSGILPMVNYSAPRTYMSSWTYDSGHSSGFPDLMIGSGDGNIIHYGYTSKDGNILNYEKRDQMASISGHKGPITPAMIDMDGDLHQDLVLGTGETTLPVYRDLGSVYYPYWKPLSTVPAFEIENYGFSFDNVLLEYDEERVSEYLDSILYPEDVRYRDEIGFSCAYTPADQLKNNRLGALLVQNARLIYSRSNDLKYVRLREYPGEGYHTTTEYRIREGEEIRWISTPKEGYYWGVVHPRITEEQVSYIDPETGLEAGKEDGGKFWREYLFEHADEEYPPGPDHPDDWSGRKVYYPRNHTPPLLKEVLSGVEVMWDLMPYTYPLGFDDQGEVNSHPWDLHDHAVEKVSHWVEKTLVLNQQEAMDDERPTQPVRIAHHHNGNCGELQDLTIAAARSALIPARGVMLTGEDHVWSEFYLGGWHQWDNYWSDGGGVLADQMNYWWGWRDRGGSGIWAQWGSGQIEDVGDNYRPSEVTGRLDVTVLDNDGDPVDGARVMVLSHWAMESLNIDVGPYQGPPPVTAPLPSIWGYTDMDGRCSLNIWRQNFNVRITSDIGTYVGDKFSIGDSEVREMTVRLKGNMPREFHTVSEQFSYSRYNLISAEIIGSKQKQLSFITGSGYNNEMEKGSLMGFTQGEWELGSSRLYDHMEISDRSPYMGVVGRYNGMGTYFVLRNQMAVKTSIYVRVRIYDPIPYDGEPTPKFFTIKNGQDKGLETYGDNTITGWITDWTLDIDWEDLTINYLYDRIKNPRISGPKGTVPVEILEQSGNEKAEMPWIAHDIRGNAGKDRLYFMADIEDNGLIKEYNVSFSLFFDDTRAPEWNGLVNDPVPWGLSTDVGVHASDTENMISALGFIDGEFVWRNPISDSEAVDGYLTCNLNSSLFPGGRRSVSMSIIDDSDNIQTAVFTLTFEEGFPEFLDVLPANGSIIRDDSAIITGYVLDDVMTVSLTISYLDRIIDITDSIDASGRFYHELNFGTYRGDVDILLQAKDNVQLVTEHGIKILVEGPPDVTSPSVRITAPYEGRSLVRGESIRAAGYGNDDRSLGILSLTTPAGDKDLLEVLDVDRWEMLLDTEVWPLGPNTITVYGEDLSGNYHSDSVNVIILDDEPLFVDTGPPSITIEMDRETCELGEGVILTGRVLDDGGPSGCTIGYSIQSSPFRDITDTMDEDGSFIWEFDTRMIDLKLYDDPEMMYVKLSDFELELLVIDGAGNEHIHTVGIVIIDTISPVLTDMRIQEVDENIYLEIFLWENTAIREMEISAKDPDGRVISVKKATDKDLVMNESEFRFAGGLELYGCDGGITIEVTAVDVWGNRMEGSEVIYISGEKEEEKQFQLFFPFILIMALIVLLSIVYIFIRRFIIEGKPPDNDV